MFYRIARGVMWVLFHLLFRISAVGTENLPAGGGYIVASNHRTQCDPVFIGICIRPTLTFMAKAELFRVPVAGLIIRWLGAFPVERGRGDTGAVDFAKQTVRSGRVLAMFPEGTRVKEGETSEAQTGAAMFATRTGVPLLPVYIQPKKRRFCKTAVVFGQPYYPQFEGRKPSADDYQRIADDLLAQVKALGEQAG